MEKAFVTGGSGFVGGRLIARLRAEDVEVAALARSAGAADRVRRLGASPVDGDLHDLAALRRGAAGADAVFHCAAHVGAWAAAAPMERDNVEGTRAVLRAARDAGAGRVVHVSSIAAVIAGRKVRFTDATPLRPHSRSRYCATKARAELAVAEAVAAGEMR